MNSSTPKSSGSRRPASARAASEKQNRSAGKTRPASRELSISLRSMRLLALGLLALLLLLFATSHLHGGYTVSYDSLGGSRVPAQRYDFQELIRYPAPPTRDGYLFTGWYLDEDCTQLADLQHPVESDLKLYAGWKPGTQQF